MTLFLKRLDLIGFKSFADRISIDFVPGVTAVVGPNGSGKSNISDAIRWVLGEQSAKNLRGSKMEDVIFSGSDSRKPLNMAEITLVLDNSDQHLPIEYSEVAVTRRIYRSGESEYFINKQPCRLRDIIELFMDSGLGKESFSIIGQGRVEEILSSKAEERRAIFEEAAGVLKYKTRKLKSEKKLQDTQDNLNRIKDIIYELESQVVPLEEQASIAEEYLEKKAELKDYEVGVLVKEIEDLHEMWSEEKKQLEALQDRENEVQASVKQYEAKIERLRVDMQTVDSSINDLQDMLLSTSQELEKQEGQREVWKERKRNFSQNREQYLQEINDLKKEKERLHEQILEIEKNLNEQKGKVNETRCQLEEKEREITRLEQNTAERIEQLKTEYIEAMNEKSAIKNEMTYIETQLEKEEGKQRRRDDENRELLKQREEIQEKLRDAQQSWKEEKETIDQLLQLYREKKEELEKGEMTYRKREELLYEAYHHIRQLQSRKAVLEEMENEYSGFYSGVKEILKERDREFQGIQGAVAELIQVDEAHQVAIEIALGAAQQHVVVNDEEVGRKAIQFLKQRKLGRATFLPMNVIKPRNIYESDLSKVSMLPGFVGVAKQLIRYDDKFENIMAHLLGNIVIATDLKCANTIASKLNYRYRIVTLDGDVINPGGAMTGGSLRQKQSNLLGRKQELKELTNKLHKLQQDKEKLEADVKQWKEKLATIQNKLGEIQQKGEEKREIEQRKKASVKELELSLENVNERLKIYDLEKHEYELDVEEKKNRFQQLVDNLHTCEEKIASLNHEIEQLSKEEELAKQSKEALSAQVLDLKVQLAKEEEQLLFTEKSYSQLNHSFSQLSQSLQLKETEFFQLEEEMTTQSEHGDSLDELIERKREEKDRIIKLISKRRAERLSLQQEHDDNELQLKEERRQLKFISTTLHETEVKVNRLDVELDNRLNKLQGEYELSFEGAKAKYPLQTDLEEAKKKVKLIKLAIDELGVVNVGAIDEYKRVKERYEFLLKQKDDLEGAKETLHQVIEEMDEEMTKRFKETFDHIQSHFHQVFRELFGGGHADLILTDPDDLLNTGVEIVAQPPGKKLQNLALLSGGEKALTAIALLFSILKVRPVPFCVLDEVEAALDEANVTRFARYLKTFSNETQFIVVTHRKGTMEEADVLYGVTMQESGVSKIMSVKLEESEALIEAK